MSSTKTESPFDILLASANPDLMRRTQTDPTQVQGRAAVDDGHLIINLNVRIEKRLRDKLKLVALQRKMTVQAVMEQLLEQL